MKKTIIASIILGSLASASASAVSFNGTVTTPDVTVTTPNVPVSSGTNNQIDMMERLHAEVKGEIGKSQEASTTYTNQKFELSNKFTEKRAVEEGNRAEAAATAAANKYTDGRIEVSNKFADKRATEEGKRAEAASNKYTDGRIEVANKYTDKRADEAQANAVHHANVVAEAAKDAAVVESNYYTDSMVGAEAVARANGDAQTLQSSKNYTNQKFAQLDKRIGKVRKEANAGTASALAASQIPQVETTGRFALGAGVGGYNSQTAVAVGFSTRINETAVTKFTVTTDTAHNVGFGAGVAVSW